MAEVNVAADNIRVRASSIEENCAILREIQAKKEVDARKQDELNVLFDGINAECVSRSLKENKNSKALTLDSSDNKTENTPKPVHYGPLPGYLPGKWWGIRMDCSRDCVHEPFNENVHDGPYGAVSICTSHLNTHNDVDLGNILTFTSREYSSSIKSKDSLVLSYKNRVPIRLVRSYCLSNKYAPKTGYRYDGLYTVVFHWIGKSADATNYHKFVLIRVLNQEPPPWLNKKVNFKTARLKKSSSRLTRSHTHNINAQECKAIKFIYSKVEKKSKLSGVCAIVSRQVYDKCASSSPENSSKLALNSDSTSQSSLCSTNLSIRTNLYDSSHQAQKVKKSVPSACKIFKPNQFVQLEQAASKELRLSSDATPATISEQKAKKVTWADACSAGLIRMNKSMPTRSCNKGCVVKYQNTADYCPSSKMAKLKNTMNTIGADHTSSNQGHSSNKANFSTKHETLHETEKIIESSGIDSLAPDELVSVIVKEKYHPMAKLLIGNMIGLENQEAAIVTAYNALTKVNQDDSKQPKENKLRSKFSIKSPAKKNGILQKKPRREIANLTIDAKFDTRSSRSRGTSNKKIVKSESTRRKLQINARRILTRNKAGRDSKKLEKDINVQDTVVKKTATTQCSLLTMPTVDRCQQTDDIFSAGMKMEPVGAGDLSDLKSEPCSSGSSICLNPGTSYSRRRGSAPSTRSAFAAVSADSNEGIARLRSIGFRPIGCNSPIQDVDSDQESSRPDVNQEYNKYTSEENDVVGYMNEQLHFQDIEEEMSIEEENINVQLTRATNILPQPIETLTEQDFDKPWHGWRKISINGQTYWTGC